MSLPNRTAGRRGRQNAFVWQTWLGYYLPVLSSFSFKINVFWSLQKYPFKGKWSLAKSYFWQNYCHACHTRFAVFVPLPSCCAISLISNLKTSGFTLSQFPPYLSFAEDTWPYNASVCIQRLFLVYLDWHDSVENGVRDTRMPKRTTGKRDISFNLDKHHMLHSSAKYPICLVLLSLVSFPIFLYR